MANIKTCVTFLPVNWIPKTAMFNAHTRYPSNTRPQTTNTSLRIVWVHMRVCFGLWRRLSVRFGISAWAVHNDALREHKKPINTYSHKRRKRERERVLLTIAPTAPFATSIQIRIVCSNISTPCAILCVCVCVMYLVLLMLRQHNATTSLSFCCFRCVVGVSDGRARCAGEQSYTSSFAQHREIYTHAHTHINTHCVWMRVLGLLRACSWRRRRCSAGAALILGTRFGWKVWNG